MEGTAREYARLPLIFLSRQLSPIEFFPVVSGTRIPRVLFDHAGWGEWELQSRQSWRLPGEGSCL